MKESNIEANNNNICFPMSSNLSASGIFLLNTINI